MLAIAARTNAATLMPRKCETQIGDQRFVNLEVGTLVAFGASYGLGEFTMNLFQNRSIDDAFRDG